jgi:hypothetical protein
MSRESGKCPCGPLPILAPSHGPQGLDIQSVDPSVTALEASSDKVAEE